MNEEATKALLLVAPDSKEGALSNPRLDAEWLEASLETNLKEQGDMMEKIAPEVHRLILKDGRELEADELEMVAYCCMQLGGSEREVAYTHRVALTYTASIIVGLAAQHAGRPELIRSPKHVLAHSWEAV